MTCQWGRADCAETAAAQYAEESGAICNAVSEDLLFLRDQVVRRCMLRLPAHGQGRGFFAPTVTVVPDAEAWTRPNPIVLSGPGHIKCGIFRHPTAEVVSLSAPERRLSFTAALPLWFRRAVACLPSAFAAPLHLPQRRRGSRTARLATDFRYHRVCVDRSARAGPSSAHPT